jgi:type I site-specific restriction-modification system R (restriction) subunit
VLLEAMYVDKRLDGVQAVQALSRLNRMLPGKENPFVLYFVNEAEDISFEIVILNIIIGIWVLGAA